MQNLNSTEIYTKENTQSKGTMMQHSSFKFTVSVNENVRMINLIRSIKCIKISIMVYIRNKAYNWKQ